MNHNFTNIFEKMYIFLQKTQTMYPILAEYRITMLSYVPFTKKNTKLEKNEYTAYFTNLAKEQSVRSARTFMEKTILEVQKEIIFLEEIKNEFEEIFLQVEKDQKNHLEVTIKMMNDMLELISEEAKSIRELALEIIDN